MLKEILESYSSKFDSPMAAYVYGLTPDESTDDSDWSHWCGRYGKRLLFEESNGFVTLERFSSVFAASQVFDGIAADYDQGDDDE